jgi:hypothetical protein
MFGSGAALRLLLQGIRDPVLIFVGPIGFFLLLLFFILTDYSQSRNSQQQSQLISRPLPSYADILTEDSAFFPLPFL